MWLVRLEDITAKSMPPRSPAVARMTDLQHADRHLRNHRRDTLPTTHCLRHSVYGTWHMTHTYDTVPTTHCLRHTAYDTLPHLTMITKK
jgi:hypothetical protein